MFTFYSLNVHKVPCFKFFRIIERYPCNKNVSGSFSGLLGWLLADLRLLEVFRGVPLLVLELPENISARRLQRFWSMVFSNI